MCYERKIGAKFHQTTVDQRLMRLNLNAHPPVRLHLFMSNFEGHRQIQIETNSFSSFQFVYLECVH